MGRQPGDQRSQPALAPPGSDGRHSPSPQTASTHRDPSTRDWSPAPNLTSELQTRSDANPNPVIYALIV